MRKKLYLITFTIFAILIFTSSVHAKRTKVEFAKCVDGDTIDIILNNKQEKVRFLAVDTPETKHPQKGKEPFGVEAKEYTCNKVSNAKKLEIEYDSGSDEKDKYDRILAWVWVDDTLLQNELVEQGLAKVAYLYGDYKYTEELQDIERTAKKEQVGIWRDYKEEPINWIWVAIGIIIIIIALFSPKSRKKLINKSKRRASKNIEKEINKNIDKLFK